MKRFALVLTTLALAALLASCGAKSGGEETASSASGGSPASSAAPASPSGGVAAVSKYDGGPRAGTMPVIEDQAEKGEKLFTTKGCSACHAFGRRLTCPDLQGVTMRRTAVWMENQILHPDVMVKEDPISHGLFAQYALQMPNQGLTPEEARSVIEYFKEQDHKAGLTPGEHH
jgi:mono/diheme cytochrome c family protein